MARKRKGTPSALSLWATALSSGLLAFLLVIYFMGDPIGIYAAVGIDASRSAKESIDCRKPEYRNRFECRAGTKRTRADRAWDDMEKRKKNFTPFGL